jgi:hypothetical protein
MVLSPEIICRFAEQLLQHHEIDIEIQPLRGGLEAAGISLVHATRRDAAASASFVVKPMRGAAVREYWVHRAVQRSCEAAAPKILGCLEADSEDTVYVFMEWVPALDTWPWRHREHAAKVLQQLARVHECAVGSVSPLICQWDYDDELSQSAASTVELYGSLFQSGVRIGERPMLRPLERIAAVVTAMRKQAVEVTGAALLHGDAHPGNAVLREKNGALEAVLLDWGRARSGSPLEDVMSWIHSLGFWEPSARRIHDTLLVEYRRACGFSDDLPSSFRSAAWLAGACNAMAGALRYHLSVVADPQNAPEVRWTSSLAAADWLRIARRADAIWRS